MNVRALPRRAFPYLIAAAGGFLLSYAAVFLFAFPAQVLPDDGILPNVVGKTWPDAVAILQKADSRRSRVNRDSTKRFAPTSSSRRIRQPAAGRSAASTSSSR
jgi:hypothetical protein